MTSDTKRIFDQSGARGRSLLVVVIKLVHSIAFWVIQSLVGRLKAG